MKQTLKKILLLTLCMMTCANLFACGAPTKTPPPEETKETSSESASESQPEAEPDYVPPVVDLNNKSVLFIGNSYVHYGNCVIGTSPSVLTCEERTGDAGLFYQLCRANGDNVTVTNWCFGGHGLYDFFGAPCSRTSDACGGKNHEEYLANASFDYVIVSPGGGNKSEQSIVEDFDYIIQFFTAKNPNVKIVCLGNLGAYGYSSFGTKEPGILNHYKVLEDRGVIIADWGGLVNGIIQGNYTVPGATQSFEKKTFIVKDGYHPNMLSGYLTALMAYYTISGEYPVGLPYSFSYDSTLHTKFDMDAYVSSNYINNNTNFPDVFRSEQDMRGLQQLVAEYVAKRPYRELQSGVEGGGETVVLSERPTSNLISVVYRDSTATGNGWMTCKTDKNKTFSGIRGDKDKIASPLINSATLSDTQKADIADIGYGVSVIGISGIDTSKSGALGTSTSAGSTNAVWNLVNGHWGTSMMAAMYFDNQKYNVNGQANDDGAYTALITLNFGEVKRFDAIGYASGNMKGFPQAHDIFVSDDGVNWTKVASASYDFKESDIVSLTTDDNPDPWNGNKASVEVLLDMGGTLGKYIRIGVIRAGDMENNLGLAQINTREILVYGE